MINMTTSAKTDLNKKEILGEKGLKHHGEFQNHRATPSERKVTQGEREEKKRR